MKKEEKNSLTNPMIAIMAPHGKSNLQLSSKESNPENLKLTPADVLSSVQDPSKKAIITNALKGHAKVSMITSSGGPRAAAAVRAVVCRAATARTHAHTRTGGRANTEPQSQTPHTDRSN